MNTIRCASKGIVFLALILLTACVKERTNYFSPENKDWITPYKIGDSFVMKDNNNISHSFTLQSNNYYFTESAGGILFFTTRRANTEYHFQEFTSNYSAKFSLSLTAAFYNDDEGDEIYIDLNDICFAYDLKNKTISRIYTPFGNLSNSTYEELDDNTLIKSTAEILDSYVVGNSNYSEVLHFEFKDFTEQWKDFTVKEIFVAKKYGLIKYVLNNNITFERE